MKKILVIVDFQYDFCDPTGTLYVPGAEEAKEVILKEIRADVYDLIIFIIDLHPKDHCSFKENGGQWTAHCIEQTDGAQIDYSILRAVITSSGIWEVLPKGIYPSCEEYGVDILSDLGKKDEIMQHEATFCGLAGDFCVLETLRMNLDNFKCKVLLNGVASIDGGEKLNKFIKENNIKIC